MASGLVSQFKRTAFITKEKDTQRPWWVQFYLGDLLKSTGGFRERINATAAKQKWIEVGQLPPKSADIG